MQYLSKILATSFSVVLATSALALTPAEHKAEKDRIDASYQAAQTQCKSLAGNAKDVCEEEAKGQKKVALADLEYRTAASESNRHKLAKAKAEASYEVAKEKCGSLSGNAKDVCIKDAKAVRTQALEAVKVSKARNTPSSNPVEKAASVAEARRTATSNVREAEYKAAVERCDSLSGAAKDKCVSDAQIKFAQ